MADRCPNCSTEITTNAQFCRRCGWLLSAPLVSPTPTEATTRALPDSPPAPDPRQTGQVPGARPTPYPTFTPPPAPPGYVASMAPPRRNRAVPILVMLAVMVLIAGGVIALVVAVRSLKPRNRVESVATTVSTAPLVRTFTLPANGEISLSNIRGRIRVVPWENNTIEFTAVRRGTRGRPLEEALEILASDRSLMIKTRDGNTTADYELKMPAKLAGLSLNTVNGDILVEGIEGNIQLTTVNGEIKLVNINGPVKTHSVNGEQTIRFRTLPKGDMKIDTVNGDIDLEFPGEPDANVNISTNRGDIDSAFPLEIKKSPGSVRASGTFGKGGRELNISTVNGDININR